MPSFDYRRRMGPVPSAAPADPYLASDTFDRTDNASLGNTDGGSLGSLAWTESNADGFSIESNKLKALATDRTAYIDVLDADIVVSAVLNLKAGRSLGIVARLSDNDNYIMAYLREGAEKLVLYSKEAGSYTVRAEDTVTVNADTDYTVALSCVGTAIVATVNGGTPVPWTSSFNQAATKVGLYSGDANGDGSNFNDFTAEAG